MRPMHVIQAPSPETVAECPWCTGPAVVRPDPPTLECTDCGVTAPLAGGSIADLPLAA